MILNYLDKKSMYIGLYKTPSKALSCLVSCLDRTPSLSEGLDEYSNMIHVRKVFKSSLYVTKQKP